MDTVEQIDNTYYFDGKFRLTASELFFWIMVYETKKQFGIEDTIAVGMILLGQNNLPTRAKPAGATEGTSYASRVSRELFKKTKFPFDISLPTIIGGPIGKMKVVWVRNLSTFVGRTIPVIGWVIMASDVSQITFNTVSYYNKIVNECDKLW